MNKFVLVAVATLLVPGFATAEFHGKPNHYGHPFSPHAARPCDFDPGPRPGGYNFHRRGYEPTRWSGYNAISSGIHSGRLSNDEVRELRRDQYEIQQKQRAYYSDGYLSRSERQDLQDARDDYYKDLNHELNDGERRW